MQRTVSLRQQAARIALEARIFALAAMARRRRFRL
jgi:hypothetical protein